MGLAAHSNICSAVILEPDVGGSVSIDVGHSVRSNSSIDGCCDFLHEKPSQGVSHIGDLCMNDVKSPQSIQTTTSHSLRCVNATGTP